MAASTAVRQTALSLDAAFMEDAVPVAATRRQTGRNLAALMIVSAIGSLALVSALAPSAGASSLRRLDDAAGHNRPLLHPERRRQLDQVQRRLCNVRTSCRDQFFYRRLGAALLSTTMTRRRGSTTMIEVAVRRHAGRLARRLSSLRS